MTVRRVVLSVLAVALGLGAFFLGTTDVFSDQQNCGAALFPKDLSQAPQPAVDPIEEDFEVEALGVRCSQAIGRQRFLTVLCLLAAAGAVVAAVKWVPRPPTFPGDPIV